MKPSVDMSRVTPVDKMSGEDASETILLQRMLSRAEEYVKSFRWSRPIADKYLGVGIGDVLALFLFRFESPINDSDEWLWVVEGDLPSAYFVIDDAPTPATALEIYCRLMGDWADAVTKGSSLDSSFPVLAEPTKEHAEMLRTRIEFIRRKIIPLCAGD